jgi:tetratricopeptide (TPR) repeat protein
MLDSHNERSQEHLLHQIAMRSHNIPNFSLFIGAGASYTSGVKTAKEMMEEWAHHLYNLERKIGKTEKPYNDWLIDQDWDDEEKYSVLFEKVYDQKPQRRNYIEECVKDAKPSWGYIYLANIIANRYFNVVLTTNFDDLLNEGSTLYPNFKPLVCAHDSAISDVRVTSARPKIIKLHGDFLYDNIKNTVRETEVLDKNMRDKFMQFAKEYGLIVIGYGGNDRSVMDILDMMIRSDENYFPHGLYWCIRDEKNVSKKVQKLLRRENTYWIKIEGFDDFMAELHERLNLRLPNSISNPYEATTEWLNRFIVPKREMNHPIIKKDIAIINQHIDQFKQLISNDVPSKDSDPYIPYEFLGDTHFNENLFEPAITYYQKEVEKDPNNTRVLQKIETCLLNLGAFSDALIYNDDLIRLQPNDIINNYRRIVLFQFMNRLDDSVELIKKISTTYNINSIENKIIQSLLTHTYLLMNKNEDVIELANEILKNVDISLTRSAFEQNVFFNKCVALRRLGHFDEVSNDLNKIVNNPTLNNQRKACYFALVGDKENMLKELKKAIKKEYEVKIHSKYDPIFEIFREDIDFKKIIE